MLLAVWGPFRLVSSVGTTVIKRAHCPVALSKDGISGRMQGAIKESAQCHFSHPPSRIEHTLEKHILSAILTLACLWREAKRGDFEGCQKRFLKSESTTY